MTAEEIGAIVNGRACTCHPDDRPAVCQHRFALTECIAASLTVAQKRWLTSEASMERVTSGAIRQWCTFPPSNTAAVLRRLGLWHPSGWLTTDGLAVRQALMEGRDG